MAGWGLPGGARAQEPSTVTVAAAADLEFAFAEIVAAYPDAPSVRVSYGSSGNIYMQIRQGAPFDLFLSADETLVERLAQAGLTHDRGRLYARGRLALYLPTASPLALDASLADLAQALDDGRLQRFAIANPAHAPYGRAAREALEQVGVWTRIEPHLVLGENVAQAAQFAQSGAAQGGLVALSLALAPGAGGRHVPIAEALHTPLQQRMVLLRRAAAPARAFYAYLGSDAVRRVFERYGFTLPVE